MTAKLTAPQHTGELDLDAIEDRASASNDLADIANAAIYDIPALCAALREARAELAQSQRSEARWITLMGEAKADRGEMKLELEQAGLRLAEAAREIVRIEHERDEARGDAEREYGLRVLVEKERDEARAELGHKLDEIYMLKLELRAIAALRSHREEGK